MKRKPLSAVLLAVALGAAAPATWAHGDRYSGHARFYGPDHVSQSIHAGGLTAEDQQLATTVADALTADTQLKGSTITLVARNGNVTLNGIANDGAQAARIERIAKRATAPGHVAATLEVQAG